ncbi:hypothetical protein N0M98_27755 [Paenibacillus doosanensis]|uniref:Uncharacterized protein n=1 Tax=Paenibacillus konkukensis TaxID=2020716 RepID=A0ABY4RVI0_9BACL|nr:MULTISPECIES: hypothetical protein [Paenibacillus]MCS7463908.1 hypothetical protein [Paenibacillus doosanensis]UQZ85775.1 hypothetical protein SK3146_05064 [Paenibacillus konkukensis]
MNGDNLDHGKIQLDIQKIMVQLNIDGKNYTSSLMSIRHERPLPPKPNDK